MILALLVISLLGLALMLTGIKRISSLPYSVHLANGMLRESRLGLVRHYQTLSMMQMSGVVVLYFGLLGIVIVVANHQLRA